MEGAGVLCNTYWIRFGRGRTTFDQAVDNSRVLFDAAARAGVGRIIQLRPYVEGSRYNPHE